MPGPAGTVPRPWAIVGMGYRNSKNRAFWSASMLPRVLSASSPWIRPRICRRVSSVRLVFHDDLSAKVDESFIHVCAPPCAGFEVGNVPFTGYGEGTWSRYRAVVF